jgi:hypothetical protein
MMLAARRSLSFPSAATKYPKVRSCFSRCVSGGRQIVRDPRIKSKVKKELEKQIVSTPDNVTNSFTPTHIFRSANTEQLPQSSGFASTLGTYVVLGAGVSLGFALVSLVLGG